MSNTCHVKTFGAVGDGLTLDTEAIQRGIDCCTVQGGELIFDEGIYLTGTIELKSNVTLNLKKNAMLLGSYELKDYRENNRMFTDAVGQKRGICLVFADNAENIGIRGEGCIHGRGSLFTEENGNFDGRPFLIRIINCRDVRMEGITIRDAAAWCSHYLDCDNVTISGVTIASRVNHNNDGIDVDSCRNVVITGCSIDTGDDGICLKATINKPSWNIRVSDCNVSSRWAAFKIGTESVGDFRDIEVKNCRFYDTEGCGIKIVPADGAMVENVIISDIVMNHCTGPVFIALGERCRSYFPDERPRSPGMIKNIRISRLKANVTDAKGSMLNGEMWGNARGCVTLSGIPSRRIQNITLEDIELTLEGGGTREEADRRDIPEMGMRYPEFHNFGILPASACFIRHAEHVRLDRVRVRLRKPDARTPVYTDDVVDLVETNIEVK